MKIGQKYDNLDSLLQAINVKDVINYFREISATNIVYDMKRESILARCVVSIKIKCDDRIGINSYS